MLQSSYNEITSQYTVGTDISDLATRYASSNRTLKKKLFLDLTIFGIRTMK